MALLVSTLATEIQKFCDQDFVGFTGFPADDAEAAHAWADSIDVYTGQGLLITPPILVPGAYAAAKAALEAGLLGLSVPGAAIDLFDLAFAGWAAAAALGMVSGAVTAATPPPLKISLTPPTIASVFLTGSLGADSATQAASMAALIDTWFRTGTFVAGGPAAPWS